MVNSAVVATITSGANSSEVTNDPHEDRRAKVTPEHEEEARKLRQLWASSAAVRDAAGVGSQLAFGAHYGIGTQGAVGSFLNGKTPLSLKAARGFADGIGCKVSDFSPRLAEILERDAQTVIASASELVGQQVAPSVVAHRLGLSPRGLSLARRFDSLQADEHRRIAYALIDNALQQFEGLEPPTPPDVPREARKPQRPRGPAG